MESLTPCHITLLMGTTLFFMGLGTCLAGVISLLARAWRKEAHTLAAPTTRLAQKSLADDVAGLVGNTNLLLNTLNELTRTATGIGIFLALTGVGMMSLAFWLVFQTRTLCLN
jgi:hypothetical protein